MKNNDNKLKYASDKKFKEKLEIWFIKDHRKGILLRNIFFTRNIFLYIYPQNLLYTR